jgi:hypothetical protein
MATEERDSEHLQEMESRAEDANPMPDLDTDEQPAAAEDETMPPGEEREEAEADAELKRIDEDVSGDEETDDMGDVESGDA